MRCLGVTDVGGARTGSTGRGAAGGRSRSQKEEQEEKGRSKRLGEEACIIGLKQVLL